MLGKIFIFFLISIKVCVLTFVLTLRFPNTLIIEITFAVFLKIYFFKYSFGSRTQRKSFKQARGSFLCVLWRGSLILRGTSPLGERGSWIPQDGTFWLFFSATELLLIKAKVGLWFWFYVFSVNSLKNAFPLYIFLINC